MEDIFTTILAFVFLIFCIDQKIIASLQRQGNYDPDTHKTALSSMFVSPVRFLLNRFLPSNLLPTSNETSSWKPEGDLSLFSYDTTVCMSKRGSKTRLSYFFDDNQHPWYKVERINERGIAVESPRFEPATVPFDVKKLQYV